MFKTLKNNNGMVLAVLIGFITVIAVGFTALTALTAFSARSQEAMVHNGQALYLAEAAISEAKLSLSADFTTIPVANDGVVYSLGQGEYYFNAAATNDPNQILVTGYGAVPSFDDPQETRVVQMAVDSVPTSIGLALNYAIFAANDININGGANVVTGNIFAGDDVSCSPASCPGVTGTKSANGDDNYAMPALDMAAMKQIAISQGNYFASTPSASDLPTSFYYTAPSGSSLGVPNIVYIEGALTVGGTGQVGGFIMVAGAYATTPSDPQGNVTISGGSKINGSVYCLGNFTSNGGGKTDPTIEGVIYAQEVVTLNGKPNVTRNMTYINALQAATFNTGDVDGSSWNEISG